jgi:hypothetical protein
VGALLIAAAVLVMVGRLRETFLELVRRLA